MRRNVNNTKRGEREPGFYAVDQVLMLLFLLAATLECAFAFSLFGERRSSNNPAIHSKYCPIPSSSPVTSLQLREKPGWLDDAMEGFNMKDDNDNNDRLSMLLPLKSGLAGFAVDPKLGFCAILVTPDQKLFLPVVVSSTDTEQLASPEALTMVQLAGGLDLGTMILPPDLLAKLAADELSDEGGDIQDLRSLRRLVTLTQINIILNDNGQNSDVNTNTKTVSSESSPERDASIQSSFQKIFTAVKGLPGLAAVDESKLLSALQIHADGDGNVDRDAFASILDYIRREVSPKKQSQVIFYLIANVISGDSIQQLALETTNAVHALGLSLRYKVGLKLLLDEGQDDSDQLSPAKTILERFPAFRPMSELLEDAQIMDGFIPSMFQQSQEIDNDMKE